MMERKKRKGSAPSPVCQARQPVVVPVQVQKILNVKYLSVSCGDEIVVKGP